MPKQLMETRLIDGHCFATGRFEAACARCADRFVEGQPVYRIAEAEGAHCGSCIVEMQEQTDLWQSQMADWYELQELGQIGPETRRPSGPMIERPF